MIRPELNPLGSIFWLGYPINEVCFVLNVTTFKANVTTFKPDVTSFAGDAATFGMHMVSNTTQEG